MRTVFSGGQVFDGTGSAPATAGRVEDCEPTGRVGPQLDRVRAHDESPRLRVVDRGCACRLLDDVASRLLFHQDSKQENSTAGRT